MAFLILSTIFIHSGLIIFLLARLLTRRPYRSFVPFACVVLAEAGNETLDYLAYGWRPTDTYWDIANTLFWPLMISLFERLQPVSIRRYTVTRSTCFRLPIMRKTRSQFWD